MTSLPTSIAQGLRSAWEETPRLRNEIPSEKVYPHEVAYNGGNVPYAVIIDGGTLGALSDHDATLRTRMFRIRCYVASDASLDRLSIALEDLARLRFACEEGQVLTVAPPLVRKGRDFQGVRSVTANLTLRVARAAPHVRRIGV